MKYAVLGLLMQRRSYGYQLVQRLSERVGPAWQLSASTVYAALGQLEQEGLVRGHSPDRESVAGGGRRSRRVIYEPTASGEEVFAIWLAEPTLEIEPIRAEFLLKVMLARETDLPMMLNAIEQARRVTEAARRESLEAPRPTAATQWEETTARLVHAAAIARLDGELHWLASVRGALESFEDGRGRLLPDLTPHSA